MRILQVHNFYQQAGGEDQVLAAEHDLLTSRGHTVTQYTVHNDEVKHLPLVSLAVKTLWNSQTYHAIRETQADLIHVHNTLPLISPAVYYAAESARIPVVQTLHNYRFLCPAATLYRDGQICEQCLPKTIKLPAIQHACYRSSHAASSAVAAMLWAHHRALRSKIHTYIALTQFARGKFLEGGLPADRITVKPNFLAVDPGPGPGDGGYALFAGRLTEEKGIRELLEAWKNCPALPLKVAGDGPLSDLVQQSGGVEYLGHCSHDRLVELLKHATLLIFPSRWYEGMPMIVLEAMACGTPVAAFAVGSMDELVLDGVNGFKTSSLQTVLSQPDLPAECAALRPSTRDHFERNFTSEINYQVLLEIYQRAASGGKSPQVR